MQVIEGPHYMWVTQRSCASPFVVEPFWSWGVRTNSPSKLKFS